MTMKFTFKQNWEEPQKDKEGNPKPPIINAIEITDVECGDTQEEFSRAFYEVEQKIFKAKMDKWDFIKKSRAPRNAGFAAANDDAPF